MGQIVMLTLLLCGCGRPRHEIDFGTFNHSVYTNRYFGMTVVVPADWSIQGQNAQRRLMKLGGDVMAGTNKNMKSLLKAGELRTVNLFAAFKYPMGTPVKFNPSVMAMAEKVRDLPGIKRGKDYLFFVKQTLVSGQIQMRFPKDIYTETLGGTDFDVMEAIMPLRGMTIHQKYYATIEKGYALCFVASFVGDKQLSEDEQVLNSVKFH